MMLMKKNIRDQLGKIGSAVLAPFNWQNKIRAKIVWMILILGGLPLTIFAFLASSMGTAYVQVETARHNQEKVRQIAKLIDVFYTSRFENIRQHILERPLPAQLGPGPDQRSQPKWLAQVLEAFPEILAITSMNPAGQMVAYASRFPQEGLSKFWKHIVIPRPRDTSMRGDEIGPLQNWSDLDEVVVPLNIFISNLQTKRIEHVLVVYYSVRPLWDKHLGMHMTEDSTIALKNSAGHILLSTFLTAKGKLVDNPAPGFAKTADGAQTVRDNPQVRSRTPHPLEILEATATCPTLKWAIVIKQSAEMPRRRVRNIRLIIFAFWAGSFVFLLVGGIGFVSRLVKPLENLEVGIKLISSGLMGDELPVFSQDEIGRLTQTFNQMTRTLMLRNEEIRGKTRELTFFNTITRIINQSVDLKTILDSSLQKILQLMHATAGMSYIYQPAFKQFKLFSCIGLSENFINEAGQLDVNHELLAKIFTHGEPSMLRDISTHSDMTHIIRSENIHDLLLVPLRSKKRTLGVLGVGSRRKRFFHYRDLSLLARIGDEIGMMVENALLYSELQLKIMELESANRELQELDRLKNRFLSNVSHELRTPITSIKTYVELFLDDKIGTLEGLQKEKLLIIRRNINNLMTLISDLLTISRLDDQKTISSGPMEVVNLPELIDQVIADTIEMARAKGLTIIRKGMFEALLVKIHRQQIRQVLQNLFSNAIKFSEKGSITVMLRRVALPQCGEDADAGAGVEISVSDTGIGIPQEELGKLFQRFYQVDSSSTRKYVGTGLGLAIVKEILAAHQIVPHVESEVGQGSRFWFILPLVNLAGKSPEY